MEMIIKVDGMTCEGCERRIENALKNLLNVNFVKANHNTKEVIITSDECINKNEIKKIIEDLDFIYLED